MIQFFTFAFSSAHFYHQPVWSTEKNQEVFGACFDRYGHGHNYRLEVGLQSPADRQALLEALDPVLKSLDHHHLNHEIEWFKDHIPTSENMVVFIAGKIKASVDGLKVIRLYETDDLWSELQF